MMDAPSRRFGDGNGDAPTPLARQLVERIRASGPLSVRAYMDACLHDPHYGYYRHAQAVGADGDFITAPEISQVFGELIGGWAVYTGQQLATQVTPGAIAPVGLSLIEVGPGRGTLMHDMLRVIDQLPAHTMDVHAHLVERNPTLEVAQRQRLANTRVPLHWHDDIAAALAVAVARGPQAPVLIIANEFLDAFAIDQWVYDGAAWRARTIDVADAEDDADADADAGDDRTPSGLRFSQGPVRTYPPALSAALQAIEERDAMAAARLSPGTILQTGVAPILAELSAYVDANSARATPPPLAALFLDYGFARTRFGDSLQAVRSHAYEHPLASPGAADLTAHVDFEATARALRRAFAVHGPVNQGDFLGRLGIVERTGQLMAANPMKAAVLEMATARLIAPQGMGGRFHALSATYTPDTATNAGESARLPAGFG